MRKIALLLLVIVALLALPAVPLSSADAGCPTYTTVDHLYSFTVQVTGADGTCPSTYSNDAAIHYMLSTTAPPSPYTIKLSDCQALDSSVSCPPDTITYQGWTLSGITTVCSTPGTACGSIITFTVDSTVQAGQNDCNTLNVKAGGSVVLILEAGDTCSTTTTTTSSTTMTSSTTTSSTVPGVPQFGASFGMLLVIALVAPMLLLLRKFSITPRH